MGFNIVPDSIRDGKFIFIASLKDIILVLKYVIELAVFYDISSFFKFIRIYFHGKSLNYVKTAMLDPHL